VNLINLIEEYSNRLDDTSIYALKSLKDNNRIPLDKISKMLLDWSESEKATISSFFEFYVQRGVFSSSYKSSIALFKKGILSHRKQSVLKNNNREFLINSFKESTRVPSGKNTLVGQKLGRCTILKKIAEGSTCDVYQADHQSLGIKVAVKIFKDFNTSLNIEGFRREAQTSARFNHPSFVRILDFDDGLLPHLVLEYVDGYPLSSLISPNAPIKFEDAARYFNDCISALQYLHEKGLAHRDIKPENILINKNSEIKISDFGISRFFNQKDLLSNSATPCGTPFYIAPEQAVYPEVIDLRSDIYSLGATFYHILTGQTPFQATNVRNMIMKHINVPVKAPQSINPQIPESFSNIIVKMMAKNIDDRFNSMAEIKDTFQDAEKSEKKKPRKRVSTIFRF